MPTIENQPERRELEIAVQRFADEVQRLRASDRYDDAEASQVLRPLCRAAVDLFKVAAEDDEIVDVLMAAAEGVIDSVTARVIVEYSFRAERDTASADEEFAEWLRCHGRAETAALFARKKQESTVIAAEQAGIVDRLIRVLNRSSSN